MNRTVAPAAVAAALAVPAVAVGIAQADSAVHISGPSSGPAAWQGVQGKKARVANALSAAPAAVVVGARVLDYPAEGSTKYVVLRTGGGAWTCFPDYDPSPGNDPICYDRSAMRWVDAYYAGRKPHLTSPGIAYRLQGGSDPSLTDPAAVVPPKGQKWVQHPPHIVVIPTGKLDRAGYGAEGSSSDAWVMFPGTPYEHLHLPVGDTPGHGHG